MLNTLPVSSLGLWMDDDTIRVAVGLCFGTPLCHPHQCSLCGTAITWSPTASAAGGVRDTIPKTLH